MTYHNDLYLSTRQVFPQPPPSLATTTMTALNIKPIIQLSSGRLEPPAPTRLQERLIRKLGPNAYPFYFQPCRVDYELKVYVADDQDDKPQKRNSVRMVIRKLTYAPEEPGPQPSVEVLRDFLMSLGSLRAEVSLDKQKYHHGESMCVNVLVDNNSNRSVKRIRVSVRQYTRIALHTSVDYKCNVADIQSEEGFPICPSQTGWCKVYRLCPSLALNRDKMGIAMDGDLKHEDTNLASSTIDVCLQLPFILTHPNPNASDLPDMDDGSLAIMEHQPQSLVTVANTTPMGNGHSQPASSAHLNGSGRNHCYSPVNPTDLVTRPTNGNALAIVPVATSSVVETATNGKSHTNGAQTHTSSLIFPPPQTQTNALILPQLNASLDTPRLLLNPFRGSRIGRHSSTHTSPVIRAGAPYAGVLVGSFQSDRRPSCTGTQSTVSEDDLLFEDFARFRLHTQAGTTTDKMPFMSPTVMATQIDSQPF